MGVVVVVLLSANKVACRIILSDRANIFMSWSRGLVF